MKKEKTLRTPETLFACPNRECESHADGYKFSHYQNQFVISRRYKRKDETEVICFKCKACDQYFSETSNPKNILEKNKPSKPMEAKTFRLCSAGMTLSIMSQITNQNPKTIAKDQKKIAQLTRSFHLEALNVKRIDEQMSGRNTDYVILEFDEQETYEKTKMKPLSILTFVERRSGFCVGFRVATFGSRRQRAAAVRLYGERPDNRREKFNELIEEVKAYAGGRKIIVCTDKKREYRTWFREELPTALHYQVLSVMQEDNENLNTIERDANGQIIEDREIISSNHPVNGQATKSASGIWLKFHTKTRVKVKAYENTYDHLYHINHYFSMTRKNLARMKRKSLAVTQSIQALEDNLYIHLALMNRYPIQGDNTFYLKASRKHGYIAEYSKRHELIFKKLLKHQ